MKIRAHCEGVGNSKEMCKFEIGKSFLIFFRSWNSVFILFFSYRKTWGYITTGGVCKGCRWILFLTFSRSWNSVSTLLSSCQKNWTNSEEWGRGSYYRKKCAGMRWVLFFWILGFVKFNFDTDIQVRWKLTHTREIRRGIGKKFQISIVSSIFEIVKFVFDIDCQQLWKLRCLTRGGAEKERGQKKFIGLKWYRYLRFRSRGIRFQLSFSATMKIKVIKGGRKRNWKLLVQFYCF